MTPTATDPCWSVWDYHVARSFCLLIIPLVYSAFSTSTLSAANGWERWNCSYVNRLWNRDENKRDNFVPFQFCLLSGCRCPSKVTGCQVPVCISRCSSELWVTSLKLKTHKPSSNIIFCLWYCWAKLTNSVNSYEMSRRLYVFWTVSALCMLSPFNNCSLAVCFFFSSCYCKCLHSNIIYVTFQSLCKS